MRAGPGIGASRSGTRTTATRASAARPSTARHASSVRASSRPPVDRAGAVSPAESVSASGTKRKDRDFESETFSEETNINVVVRCRGRSEREVRENSAVVVRTDGVKGKLVELSMGANALSNKTYNFDRVFSQAADQNMVFDDAIKPILDEMLAGYNCTIFAYGQTGTGKTYTMSGDMTETMGMLSVEAGIIPRVLQQLFNKLEIDDTENCVRCSFIELYNEELRDLLSVEESAKLKIFDDASRRGHAGTIVQGMEEKHIRNASEGIKVLQDGSLKRQVAATKCNELSSRSHTVFTITAYVKKTNEHGVDDLVSAGKLNLVDLAGSENIQRSGAENKRAAEAGLINKSLLTLGRVINALVDRGAHIPYRESKLTRLLQDSLGGRTKTCIIATISPAKSNLEETISTLEYAFRAKNIRNKPQLNPMLNKKMLLRDFANEIERLKSELITTRQRNGVYMSNDAYEEMTAQSESRRIVLEEQSAKMETLEANLRNKVQELFSLTSTFMGLKKDHEGTKAQLDETKSVLDQTDIVLAATRNSLAEEAHLRKAHEATEEKLTEIGGELLDKLERTVRDVGGLHAKNKRKSDLQSLNRASWSTSQTQVADVTTMVERRMLELRQEQLEHISSVSRRMEGFVGDELHKLSSTQASLGEQLDAFADSKRKLLEEKQKSREEMEAALDEIKAIRDSAKDKVSESLQAISQAAERIAAEVLQQMTGLHSLLHASYSSLGKDFKAVFEDLVRHMTAQRCEAYDLRRQLQSATGKAVSQNAAISARIQEALEEERRLATEDRQKLVAQMTALVNAQAETQEARMVERAAQMQRSLAETKTGLEEAVSQYDQGMGSWDEKQGQVLDEVKKSRDQLKTRLKDDWTAASEQGMAIRNTAKSVQAETVRVVDEQIEDLDSRMAALDNLVAGARVQLASQHESQSQAVQSLGMTVEQSVGAMMACVKTSQDRIRNLGDEVALDADDLRATLDPVDAQLCQPLAGLREGICSSALHEYQPTGETPQKVVYTYPTTLPKTEPHEVLLSRLGGGGKTSLSARRDGAAVSAGEEEEEEEAGEEGDDGADRNERCRGDDVLSVEEKNGDEVDGQAEAGGAQSLAGGDDQKKASPPPRARRQRQRQRQQPSAGGSVPDASWKRPETSLREVHPNLTTPSATTTTTMAATPGSESASQSAASGPGEPVAAVLAKRNTRSAAAKRQAMVVDERENMPLTAALSHGSSRGVKSPRLS